MQIAIDTGNLADYAKFLKIKSLPRYRISGGFAEFPDEYAGMVGVAPIVERPAMEYVPSPFLFDYQRDITAIAVRKKKFCIFADCGLGKQNMEFEFARHAHAATGLPVLMVAPLMVVTQAMEEREKFYGLSLPIEQLAAKDLRGWLKNGTGVGITNFEAIDEDLPPAKLGGLVIDECFAAGTPVEVYENGKYFTKHIEKILCGDTILNASGLDTVTSIHRREVQRAINVDCGTKITCSPNHPFFTQRGWVCAQDLEPGDAVAHPTEAMRMVREAVLMQRYSRARTILRSILLSEMADEPSCSQGQGSHEGDARKDRPQGFGMVEVWNAGCTETDRADPQSQSHERSGSAAQSLPPIASHEAQTFRAWGERDWFDGASKDHAGCSGTELEGGVMCIVGEADSRLSHELQARLGERRSQSRYRSGWSLSSLPEGERQKEGCKAGFSRVEGIAVLEPGHPELERLRDADGKLYFYDLEAERHPSFSVSGLLVHNSSMFKSHYGAWGTRLIEMGRGVEYKLAATGTPAPNDRIEYANHAVFMDAYPNVNSFLARFFVNRGQTSERWELKKHAVHDFYRALSHWCIFLANPATYGWKDNCGSLPPIKVIKHTVPLTKAQRDAFIDDHGSLFLSGAGGIGERGKIARLGKGIHNGKKIDANKTKFIVDLIAKWSKKRSTIVWCKYNPEQEEMAKEIPGSASITGTTPLAERQRIIHEFKAGRIKTLVSKPRILGLGLNLQVCTRMVFSSCQDSYEEFYQACKRANRVGSTEPLEVHIPFTDYEAPMIENVLDKAHRVAIDAIEQEEVFRQHTMGEQP